MTAISSKYVFIAVCKCIFFSIDWLSPNQEAEKTFPLQPFKDELLQVCRTFVILYTYAQHTMADLLAIPPCYSDQTAAISLTALSSLLTSSSGLLLAPSAILIGQPLMIYCNSHTSKLIYPSIQGMPSLYSNLYVDRWQSELPFKVPLFSDRMLGDQAGPRRKVSLLRKGKQQHLSAVLLLPPLQGEGRVPWGSPSQFQEREELSYPSVPLIIGQEECRPIYCKDSHQQGLGPRLRQMT